MKRSVPTGIGRCLRDVEDLSLVQAAVDIFTAAGTLRPKGSVEFVDFGWLAVCPSIYYRYPPGVLHKAVAEVANIGNL